MLLTGLPAGPPGSSEPDANPCPAGSFCAQGSASPAPCPAGFFCPAESVTPTPCDPSFRCPVGSAIETGFCAAGFERVSPTSCVLCPATFACDGSGPDGNKQICPRGSYCPGNGQIIKCPESTLCEQGSSAPGAECTHRAKSFSVLNNQCNCYTGFVGTTCERCDACFPFFRPRIPFPPSPGPTQPPSTPQPTLDPADPACTAFPELCISPPSDLGPANITSDFFTDSAVEFLIANKEAGCDCGFYYDPDTGECADLLAFGILRLNTFGIAGNEAIREGLVELGAYGYEAAITCFSAPAPYLIFEQQFMEEILEVFVEDLRAWWFTTRNDLNKTDKHTLATTLVAAEYTNATFDTLDYVLRFTPGAILEPFYEYSFFWASVTTPEAFYDAHIPPYKFCTAEVLLELATDCGSVAEDVEKAIAVARCVTQPSAQVENPTILGPDAFVFQALYCVRSLRAKVEAKYGQAQANVALRHIAEMAAVLDERFGPSESTSRLVNLALSSLYRFDVDVTGPVPVPPQPLSFFQSTLVSQIQALRDNALRFGARTRTAEIQSKVDTFQTQISQVVGAGFSGLNELLLSINSGILDSFFVDASTNAISVQAELEALKDTFSADLSRIERSATKFVEYANLLDGARVDDLLAGLEELVEIQSDRDEAVASVAKAQATLNLIKGIIKGVAGMALSVISPAAATVVTLGIDFIPVRRRLQNEKKEKQRRLRKDFAPGDDKAEAEQKEETLEENRKLQSCQSFASSSGLNFFEQLSAKGASYASKLRIGFAQGQDILLVLDAALKTAIIAYESTLLLQDCTNGQQTDAQKGLSATKNFLKFFGAESNGKRALYTFGAAYSLAGLAVDFERQQVDDVVAPFLECDQSGGRRLTQESRRELAGCNPLTAFSKLFGGSSSSAAIATNVAGDIGKEATKKLAQKILDKGLGVVTGALDIGFAIKNYQSERTAAEALFAQAIDIENQNTLRVNQAIDVLKTNLEQISNAFLAALIRLDFIQLGLPYDDIISSGDAFQDSFGFLPTIWDSIFNDVMDLLEFEVLICPQIDGASLISGLTSRRRLESKLRQRAKPLDEANANTMEARRSLGAKQDKKDAQERLRQANQRFREVSERMDQVECPRFERTLRNVVDWGKAIHEAVYNLLQKYREFERLFAKQNAIDNRRESQEEVLNRSLTGNTNLLGSLSSQDAESEIKLYATVTGVIDTNLEIFTLIDRTTLLLQEFCNSHLFVNPSQRSSVCDVDLFALEASSATLEDFLFAVAASLDRVLIETNKAYFEVAYG